MCPPEDQVIEEASRLIQSLLTERRRAERMQQEFLSVISHELRTPLAAMLGALGLLRRPRVAIQPQKADELLEIAERNGGRLLRLINDLLDLQRLEAGTLSFQIVPVRIGDLLEKAVEDVRELALLYKVRVLAGTGAATASLMTDRERVGQVLLNLLTNAVKHSPAGGEVLVAGRVLSGQVELTVRDAGPGIPEELKGRLFESFAQAEPSTVRHRGGAGLGLSISKKMIEGLGGTISIDSSQNEGTTVAVLLPLQAV